MRTVALHSGEVYLASKLMFAFILLFVLAVDVVWELAEFAIDLVSRRFGFDAALAQRGVNATVGDLLFNLTGAVVAAALGATYLTDSLAGSPTGSDERPETVRPNVGNG